MSNLKICRICLRTECKVYKFDRFQLKAYYEEVMCQKVKDDDNLPHHFCYECAIILHKFHKFKEKCYIGHNTLRELAWKGEISYAAIYKVDRESRHLKSPLAIVTATNRVKTYLAKDLEHVIIQNRKRRRKEIDESESQDNSEYTVIDNDPFEGNSEMEPVFVPAGGHIDISNTGTRLSNSDCYENGNDDAKCESREHDGLMKYELVENQRNETKRELVENDVGERKCEAIGNGDRENDFFESLNNDDAFDEEDNIILSEFKGSHVIFDGAGNEEIKINEQIDIGLKKSRPQFAKQRKNVLDSGNWKKTGLTEEEALREFRAKAEDPKYIDAKFKCTDCFRGFSKEEMLKRHNKTRHCESLGSLECRFCRMRFKWDCLLRKHLRAHFTRYQCLRCPLICSLETSAILHEDYHNGDLKKCMHCGEEFKHRSTYYTHLRSHRSAWLCARCGAGFVSALGLAMHRRIKHPPPLHSHSHPHTHTHSPQVSDDDEDMNTFCEKCSITFETRKAYDEHLFHSAMHMEGVDDSDASKKILAQKVKEKITSELRKSNFEDPFPPIDTRKRRKRERKFHRKPTTCHQCGERFGTQAACLRHHAAAHRGTSFFPPALRHICELCGASLAPGSVAMHQNLHTREKLFPCATCGRTFHASVGLKRHLVTHTGEKPYACNLCDKRFTQSNSMKLHVRTFHQRLPYPKRNRRTKKMPEPEESSSSEVEAEKNSNSKAADSNKSLDTPGEQVRYLTLN